MKGPAAAAEAAAAAVAEAAAAVEAAAAAAAVAVAVAAADAVAEAAAAVRRRSKCEGSSVRLPQVGAGGARLLEFATRVAADLATVNSCGDHRLLGPRY